MYRDMNFMITFVGNILVMYLPNSFNLLYIMRIVF